jgi:zinc protease
VSPRIARGLAAVLALASGCDFGFRLSGEPPVAKAPAPTGKPTATAVASVEDPLGPRPELGAVRDFVPPEAAVHQGPGGITVWHLERKELPVVSVSFVLPYGSSSDPSDKPGTMSLLADMMDEGAGGRSALELSEALASLGASFGLGTNADSTTASLTALRTRFDASFEILCDVVARPKLEAKDFERVHKVWKNNLKKRADDPGSVAQTVLARTMYGPTSPYGHPSGGLLSRADAVKLADVRAAHASAWRPDRLVLVVVGQISRAEIDALLEKNLGRWSAKGEPLAPPAPSQVLESRPRSVLVHREGAVQSFVLVAGPGVAASSAEASPLELVNSAVGGSFTSRLNLELRERKNWTYGAGSRFSLARSQGTFYARTSLEAPFTGPGLAEIFRILEDVSAKGITADELSKAKAQDRRDLIETFEGATSASARFSQLAAAGLPPGYDGSAAKLRQVADLVALAPLSKQYLDPSKMTVVLVGDRATVKSSLRDAAVTLAPIEVDAEGRTEAEVQAAPEKTEKPKAEKPKTEKPKTEKPKTEKPKTEKPKPKTGR